MNGGAVKDRQRGLVLIHRQAEFGTPQNHALGALLLQPCNDLLKILHGFRLHTAQAQLLKDDAASLCLFRFGWYDRLDSVRRHAFGVEPVAHGEGCAQQPHPLQPLPLDGGGGGVNYVQ